MSATEDQANAIGTAPDTTILGAWHTMRPRATIMKEAESPFIDDQAKARLSLEVQLDIRGLLISLNSNVIDVETAVQALPKGKTK